MRIADTQIEVVVFDLFGVLVSFDDDLVIARLARHCAYPTDAFERLHKLTARHDLITGAASLPEIHRELVAEYGLVMSFPEFEAAWLEPYHQPISGMVELVDALSKHYRLVLLSNVDRDYWQVVRGMHPELDYFEFLLVSCDLGRAKPDPEVFWHVCQLTGTEPKQCFFVDDTAQNVEAARALGFHGHVFRSVPELRTVLEQANARGL
ncbi:MAG: HAD family phosphatase [Dehalococcoidia bacterium]|nr:HAD family phosphatase [Dehalococcoidia bacterium]